MGKLLTLLSALCSALAGLLRLRRKAQAEARRSAISQAVHSGDAEAAARLHHTLLKLLWLGLLPAFALLSGCTAPEERLLILNQPMAPVRMEHAGSPGWWLSDCLYEATLLKLDTLQTERNTP